MIGFCCFIVCAVVLGSLSFNEGSISEPGLYVMKREGMKILLQKVGFLK
jgi:hypothetical protein